MFHKHITCSPPYMFLKRLHISLFIQQYNLCLCDQQTIISFISSLPWQQWQQGSGWIPAVGDLATASDSLQLYLGILSAHFSLRAQQQHPPLLYTSFPGDPRRLVKLLFNTIREKIALGGKNLSVFSMFNQDAGSCRDLPTCYFSKRRTSC